MNLFSLWHHTPTPALSPAPAAPQEPTMPDITVQTIPSTPAAHLTPAEVNTLVLQNLANAKARAELSAKLAAQAVAVAAEKRVKAVTPIISALSLPDYPPVTPAPAVATPTEASAEAPAPDVQSVISGFISTNLPALAITASNAFKAPFSFGNVLALGSELNKDISYMVAVGLPAVKGMDAEALVQVLVAWALDTYLRPFVPIPFLYNMARSAVLKIVQTVYETKVKALIGKATAAL